jgi:transposase-like protein
VQGSGGAVRYRDGSSVAEVARELGIYEVTWGNWVNQWKRENPEPEKSLSLVERVRVAEVEDEIRKLRMENEFLKKAAAFLAKTQP